MECGRQVYHFEHISLSSLLQETFTVFVDAEHHHTFHLTVADPLPPVRADNNRLRQVVTNLLSTAIKFSPQGGTITVGVRQEENNVMVWVTDQGVGIPPEAIPKLFRKFFRVDNHETRSIGGTGLGLALIKKIVEAHGGQVWVKSTLGQGSTFFFSLPAMTAALQHTREHDESIVPTTSGGTTR
jgi:signal transduction histidine kinase